jgi:hypothetical protein
MIANQQQVEMTEPTLEELDVASIIAKRGKAGRGGMIFHSVSGLKCLLLPVGEYTTVPYKPGVYQGDGTEKRLNVNFQINDAQRIAIEAIEERIRDQLEIPASAWTSCSKPADFGALLRTKMNIDGPRQVQITGVLKELPEQWPQRANAYLQATCVYQQARASGLLFEVIALDFGDPGPVKKTNPFARRQK